MNSVDDYNTLTRNGWRVLLWLVTAVFSTAGPGLLADEGLVYPEDAGVQMAFEVEADITTIRLTNKTENPVQHFFFSHHSVARSALVSCVIDGQSTGSIPTQEEYATVEPSAFTVRWLIGDFEQTVELTYFSPFDPQNRFNWSAGHPSPIFGLMPRLGSGGGASCCEGRVGDANGLGGDTPTISDLSTMIAAKFIYGYCGGVIDCLGEADLDRSGAGSPTCNDITISDIANLIDYLFISGPALELAECP